MTQCFSWIVRIFCGVFLGWHMMLVAPVFAQETPVSSGATDAPIEPQAEISAPTTQPTDSSTIPEAAQTKPKASATQSTKNLSVFEPSFGKNHASLMFGPADTRLYLETISKTEYTIFSGVTLSDVDIEKILEQDESTVAQTLDTTKMVFPHFYIPTILYHNPSHWWVKVNGMVITPKTNNVKHDLYIIDIQPHRISVLWKPNNKDIYFALSKMQLSTIDKKHMNTIAHRTAKTSIPPRVLDGEKAIRFTLQPNQVFYSKYMTVYEGNPRGIGILPAAANISTAKTGSPSAGVLPPRQHQNDELGTYKSLTKSLQHDHDRRQKKKQERDNATPTETNSEALSPLDYMEEVLKELQTTEKKKPMDASPASIPQQEAPQEAISKEQIEAVQKAMESLESLPDSTSIVPAPEPEPESSLIPLESLDSLDSLDAPASPANSP